MREVQGLELMNAERTGVGVGRKAKQMRALLPTNAQPTQFGKAGCG
jgi:hypothetical protein